MIDDLWFCIIALRKVSMLEFIASRPYIGVLVVLMLFSLVLRAAPINSWKIRTAGVIALSVIALQYAVRWICRVPFLWALLALMALYVVYCVCLIIWREKNVPRLSGWQYAVITILCLSALLPSAKMIRDRQGVFNCYMEWQDALYNSPMDHIPGCILGMKISSAGGPEGMHNVSDHRYVDGKITDVVYLEDDGPRNVQGEVFVAVKRKCTLKTLTPFEIVADTAAMSSSPVDMVMDKAREIAEGVKRDCGFVLKPLWGASITSSSDSEIRLYGGRSGNLDAEICWIREGTDSKQGVLRMRLRDSGMWLDEATNSLIYIESAGEN